MSTDKRVDIELTQEAYDKLKPLPGEDDWKFVPLGTRFLSSTDPTTVCETCRGLDMFAHQWGAGVLGGPPERGLRWYKAVIIEPEQVASGV